MPGGIPVATVAIGNAKNAGLLAVQILATTQPDLMLRVQNYRQELSSQVLAKQNHLDAIGHRQYLAERNQVL
jgi:5-(carboxyamino)imidazole ribonucleotide mutase